MFIELSSRNMLVDQPNNRGHTVCDDLALALADPGRRYPLRNRKRTPLPILDPILDIFSALMDSGGYLTHNHLTGKIWNDDPSIWWPSDMTHVQLIQEVVKHSDGGMWFLRSRNLIINCVKFQISMAQKHSSLSFSKTHAFSACWFRTCHSIYYHMLIRTYTGLRVFMLCCKLEFSHRETLFMRPLH